MRQQNPVVVAGGGGGMVVQNEGYVKRRRNVGKPVPVAVLAVLLRGRIHGTFKICHNSGFNSRYKSRKPDWQVIVVAVVVKAK